MSILVTRPSPAGDDLVRRLRALGREAWSLPLIEFSPGRELQKLPAYLHSLDEGDLAFVLSQHVVEYASAALARESLRWPAQANWFAIGRTSALAFHQASNLPIIYPRDRESSENLLQFAQLQAISGRKALILRGNGGRELLGETLSQRGATVTYCECYQRCKKHYDGAEEAHRWQSRGVKTLVVTSAEMLSQLWAMVPEWYRNTWLLRCRLFVVSERLATQAREAGWQDVRIADNADNDALLRALQQHEIWDE
ncbi:MULTISPECIES: uroporphyrinogen-III synthase [Tenebrionibacter/Tenebrionicola group]|jgi:uroporphyrinogen-III synthase|uniref:Uroporphyrinogen-III synthase n=2 Tax=Tenebrionibacter/Tenebrionicola group TaxID=2969848 RepID=A0A8K0V3L0_9ENTR|nr:MULTISPECIES: uroporphyrinogen-III synthase [Tenebrionibacter/Tenebrionicola group]MBK4714996.1 uroporphyrinogen-III synthase [Tenebrionibacter intestinalis]MBV5095663.1 uroporphyrinogen-III synthase [Tenebrionicola larvae]